MTDRKTYRITIGSAFAGGRDHLNTAISLPLNGEMAYALGTEWPTAQALAEHLAGEYCDSGSVSVVNTRDHSDRGIVGRALLT